MTKNTTKEVKSYYSNDRLNKGFAKEKEEAIQIEKPPITNLAKKYEYLLPPVEVMAEYQEMYPGTMEKLMLIAEREQEQKFAIEKLAILSQEKARKLGALFGFFTASMICAATVQISHKDMGSALIFAAIAFSAIFAISLFSLIRNRGYEKNKYHHNRHKNENQQVSKDYNKSKRFNYKRKY